MYVSIIENIILEQFWLFHWKKIYENSKTLIVYNDKLYKSQTFLFWKKKLDIYWKKFDCSAADKLKKFGAILIEEWQILFLKTFG